MDTTQFSQLLKRVRLNAYFLFGIIFAVFVLLILAVMFLTPRQAPEFPEMTASPTPAVTSQLPSQIETTEVNGQPVPVGLPVIYQVQPGDSSWKIAQAFYGSGFNYVDIEAANNLAPNALLEVGQELLIPAVPVRSSIQTAENRQPTPTPTPSVSPSPEPSPTAVIERNQDVATTHLIQPGDSLWHISLNELGDPYRWPEIYELNREAIGDNPDLIYPGIELKLPTTTK